MNVEEPGGHRHDQDNITCPLVGGAEIPLSTTKCSHHLKIQSCVILFGGNVRTSSWGGSVSGSMEEAREGVRIIGVCHNGVRQSELQRITAN